MEITAQLRLYRQSPRKTRLVADCIRGLDANEALVRLEFTHTRAAKQIHKLVQSALANASHNFSLDPGNMFVKKIMVDAGPTLKRWRARAFGRAAPIRKRTSHITIFLDEKKPTQKHPKATKEEKEKDAIVEIKTREEIKDTEAREPEKKNIAVDHSLKKPLQAKKRGFTPHIFKRKTG